MDMNNIEAYQYPIKGRQVGIDLAKCLAIIFNKFLIKWIYQKES